jgi:hypothetical protein
MTGVCLAIAEDEGEAVRVAAGTVSVSEEGLFRVGDETDLVPVHALLPDTRADPGARRAGLLALPFGCSPCSGKKKEENEYKKSETDRWEEKEARGRERERARGSTACTKERLQLGAESEIHQLSGCAVATRKVHIGTWSERKTRQ